MSSLKDTRMKLEEFTRERTQPKQGKYRTMNVDEELHLFFKRTANHYNIAIADLMYNILVNWKKEYQKEIHDDMIKRFED